MTATANLPARRTKEGYASVATTHAGPTVPIPGKNFHAHVGTSNASFVKVSEILAQKGVMNNRFMLALFDSELAGVDPRSPDLDVMTQGRILAGEAADELDRHRHALVMIVQCSDLQLGQVEALAEHIDAYNDPALKAA